MTETVVQPGSGAAIRAASARIADPEQRVLERIAEIRKRKPTLREDAITMSHGAGGKASHTLTTALFADILSNPVLDQLGDQAVLPLPGVDNVGIAVTTDSFVVSPLSSQAVTSASWRSTARSTTSRSAARPRSASRRRSSSRRDWISPSCAAWWSSIRRAADRAGVNVVTGDTKVVPRGKADQLFITTTGVGTVALPQQVAIHRIVPGDVVVLSGAMGDHGATVMLARGDVDLEADNLRSDTMPLARLDLSAPRRRYRRSFHARRDPGRRRDSAQ